MRHWLSLGKISLWMEVTKTQCLETGMTIKIFLSATEHQTLAIIPSEYKSVVFPPVILVGV